MVSFRLLVTPKDLDPTPPYQRHKAQAQTEQLGYPGLVGNG